jgi:hypothetical protein
MSYRHLICLTIVLFVLGICISGCNEVTPIKAVETHDRVHVAGVGLIASLESDHLAGRLTDEQWQRVSDYYRIRLALGAELQAISDPDSLPDPGEAQRVLDTARGANEAWKAFIEPLLPDLSLQTLSTYHADQAILRQYGKLADAYLANPNAANYREMASMGLMAVRVLTGIPL